MAERPNAGALKASEVKASGGSNPSLAAKQEIASAIAWFASKARRDLGGVRVYNANDGSLSRRETRNRFCDCLVRFESEAGFGRRHESADGSLSRR